MRDREYEKKGPAETRPLPRSTGRRIDGVVVEELRLRSHMRPCPVLSIEIAANLYRHAIHHKRPCEDPRCYHTPMISERYTSRRLTSHSSFRHRRSHGWEPVPSNDEATSHQMCTNATIQHANIQHPKPGNAFSRNYATFETPA